MKKKYLSLITAFVMVLNLFIPTIVNALNYDLETVVDTRTIINSYNITSEDVTLYVGNVSVDGVSQAKYLYTDKSVNVETINEIKKILPEDYQAILPTTAGQIKASNNNEFNVQDFYTDAGMVAAGKYESIGTVEDMSSVILYNQTELNNLQSASSTELSEEVTAEENNASSYNARKAEWDAEQQQKADEDPSYIKKEFPEEYVFAFNDESSYPEASFFILDNKGPAVTGYIVRNGVVAQVDNYPINRTIIKVVNTSANVITETEEYNLWIGDTQVTNLNANDILKDGKVSYDVDTNTITLNGATITGGGDEEYGWGIKYNGADKLNIVANGNNTVTDATNRNIGTAAILIGNNIGNWSLDPNGHTNLNITINEGATLTLNGGEASGGYYPQSYGICLWQNDGDVTIYGEGTLNATGGEAQYSYGISTNGKITLNSSGNVNVTTASDVYYSTAIFGTSIVINDGNNNISGANAENSSFAISTDGSSWSNPDNGKIIINGGNTIATAGTIFADSGNQGYYDPKSIAIIGDNDLTINGGTIEAKTLSDKDNSMAISLNNGATLNCTYIIGASTNEDGTDAVEYNEEDNNTYKWFKAPWTDPTALLKGDLDRNNVVDANDASVALELYKSQNATPEDIEIGDMDNNQLIDANDASLILEYYKTHQ